MTLTRTVLICTMLAALSGCLAPVLVGVAPIVGGMIGSKHQLAIDENSVAPEFKTFLPKAKKIALLGNPVVSQHIASHLESNSDYVVSLLSPTTTMSLSQSKAFMKTSCDGPEKPDIILYSIQPQPEVVAGVTVTSMFIGRKNIDIDFKTEVLLCHSGHRSQFGTTGKINQGTLNADQAEVSQLQAEAFSAALLRLAGKLPSAEAG